MVNLITNFIFVSLLILVLINEVRRKKVFIFDVYFFFNIWFFFAYILTPFLIINFGSEFAHSSFYVKSKLGPELSTLVIFIFYLSVLFGYKIKVGNNKKLFLRANNLSDRDTLKFVTFLFSIGFLSFLFFIYQYGGIVTVLENVNTIRNGSTERNTAGAVVGLFAVYLSISYYILLAVVVKKGKEKKNIPLLLKLLLTGLLLLSIGYAFTRGSREGLIEIFLFTYLIFVFINKRLYFKFIITGIPIVLFTILYGKVLFTSLSIDFGFTIDILKQQMANTDLIKSFQSTIHNFAHPFMSLNQAINETGNSLGMRYFMDIPYSFIFYLQLFGFDAPMTITYINTYLAIGRYESNIPPGLVALLWYNFKIFGVVIGGLTFGYLIRFINDLFYSLAKNNSPIFIVIYLQLISTVGHFIFVGDLRVSIIQNFAFVSLVLAILLLQTKVVFKSK